MQKHLSLFRQKSSGYHQNKQDFRRVHDAFVESLTQELFKEPCGSYGCLFVVAKKETFASAKKDAYEYDVLNGFHLMLGTK